MTRMVYHVTAVGDAWAVRRARRKRPECLFTYKPEAVSHARRLARAAALGQVKVHGRNGRMQAEYTYGRDPRRTRG